MSGFISSLLLLIVASIVYYFCNKWKFPYTIMLFLVGVLLIPISELPYVGVVASLQFSPELLFFVFLPVLIFEAGYNIHANHLIKNSFPIWTLATFGLILSSVLISVPLFFILGRVGIDIPYIVLFLFGVIISSTDPVAVLAIFKEIGIPKRLQLIFEGESLFNDGTAVAIFLIVLSLIQNNAVLSSGNIWMGILTFICMVLGGIILGSICGFVFAKGIQYIKNNEAVEISLTMILAHVTFILCEYINIHMRGLVGREWLQVSGVIATAYAAIIMGNYGKTKISPKVEAYMDKFRSFFAFITNSLIFLLMGLTIKDISLSWSQIWIPLSLGIFLTVISRPIVVYLSVLISNRRSEKGNSIPKSWQYILARGDLKGAIGLTLVLLLPDDLYIPGRGLDFSIKDFMLAMVIGSVFFSLCVKGLSITKLINYLGINRMTTLEQFEQYESEIIVYTNIIEKIHRMKTDYHTSQKTYDILLAKYQKKLDDSLQDMQTFLQTLPNPDKLIHTALGLHALGIEKEYLKSMFSYNEIDEHLFQFLQKKLDRQRERVERGEEQIQGTTTKLQRWERGFIRKFTHRYTYRCSDPITQYHINRTKFIISAKVIKYLKNMQQINFGFSERHFTMVIGLYKKFHDKAQEHIQELKNTDPTTIKKINQILLIKSLMKTEEKLIQDLYSKDMICTKLYHSFSQEIENEVAKTFNIKNIKE